MVLENLVVQRLILHEVFRRRDDKNVVPPRYGGQLIQLQPEPMDVFVQRVVDAMGSDSQSMAMEITDAGKGSAIEIAAALLGANDGKFITESQLFADRLANVQVGRNLPGGVVVVFAGTVGNPARKFVGVIKAETQTGFRRELSRGVIGLRYLEDLFLTPAAKLYKIGIFVQRQAGQALPKGWDAFVYDSHMGSSRDGAARYFFGLFLGCSIPENSAFLTKSFFEHTREFIKAMPVQPEQKADLLTSLYTYLKVDQTQTIEVNQFSNTYIPSSSQAEYKSYMQQQKFPQTAVAKDTTDIKSMLRQRKLVFPNNIRLTAPPEAFKDMIEIKRIPSGKDGVGASSEWTQITIRDRIVEQE
jgi:hypothetical protein